MKRRSTSFRTALFGAMLLAAAALAADEPTQTVRARGLTFQAPAAWKSSQPRSAMRAAELTVKPVQGDTDPAELVVFAFPGSAGSVADNIKRWESQFQDASGKAPRASTEKRKGKNVEVTFVELAGRYVAAVTPGGAERHDKPNYRLLGAIVETPQVAYFLKMVGPDKTMKAARPAFDELIKSISVEAQ